MRNYLVVLWTEYSDWTWEKNLRHNHYTTIHESVRTECYSYRKFEGHQCIRLIHLDFHGWVSGRASECSLNTSFTVFFEKLVIFLGLNWTRWKRLFSLYSLAIITNGIFTLHGHGTRTGTWPKMESIVSWRDVHIGLRQGQTPGPIVSYCASLIPFSDPSPVPVQCE